MVQIKHLGFGLRCTKIINGIHQSFHKFDEKLSTKTKTLLKANQSVFISVIKMTSSLSLQKPVADINIIVILARGTECTV